MSDDVPNNLLEMYKLAVATRQFEIQMFWQRSNYFIFVNAAIAAGFFSLKMDSPTLALVLSVLGILVCWCWLTVNLGSKFWQSRWEEAASDLEQLIGPTIKLFSSEPKDNRSAVEKHQAKSEHNYFERWIDQRVLRKPSVSLTMMGLSATFIAFWVLLAVASLAAFWTKSLQI